MKLNNTIEINGRLYDAKTGQALDKSGTSKKQLTSPQLNHPKSIDGFRSKKIAVQQHGAPNKTATPSVPATKQVSSERPQAHKAKLQVAHSQTLNRQAVRAPKIEVTQPKSTATSKPASTAAVKQPANKRLERAQSVPKSNLVARFNHVTPTVKKENTTHFKPASQLTSHVVAESEDQTAKRSVKEQLVQQAMAAAVTAQPTKAQKVHSKKYQKVHKHHFMRYAATGVVALVLAGYVAYLNVPSISMKIAARRAGFAAALPGYTPAGYSLHGPIAYNPGQVTLNFHSNTDGRVFALRQQPTTWDSTALLENYVNKKSPSYLTYQDRGLTIYIYNGSSASWVNGGKLYNLEGSNSQLDTDQLLKLATSV